MGLFGGRKRTSKAWVKGRENGMKRGWGGMCQRWEYGEGMGGAGGERMSWCGGRG